VKELFTGIVKMVNSGDVLKIDQTHLETVIPAIGNVKFNSLANKIMYSKCLRTNFL
jgi:hypothetical protein